MLSPMRTLVTASALLAIAGPSAGCSESTNDPNWRGSDASPDTGAGGAAGAAGGALDATAETTADAKPEATPDAVSAEDVVEPEEAAPPEPTCSADAKVGDYCGGDKVDHADANTLYVCNGPGPATVKEVCSEGCVVAPAGEDDYCKPAIAAGCADAPTLEAPSSCPGSTTSELSSSGFYATSWFGCYLKGDGTIYKDPYDNCEFACGNKGLCDSSLSGPECEAELKWFAADADRFGCGARIRVTNCENGRSIILATLDRGPNCGSVEQPCGAATLDMSHPAMEYLFEGNGYYGACDHQAVFVEEVDAATPLGPEG